MPPGEEGEGGGRPGGGRAEGGAPNPGGGFEGQRGREAGSVGGEGEEARAAWGWGPGWRGRRGWRERRTPAHALALPASPSLSALNRPGAPDAASQLPGWRGRGSNCKTFRRLHRVAGPGLRGPEAGGGDRGKRLTQAVRPEPPALPPPPSLFPLPAFLASTHPLLLLGGPLPRSGREGAEPKAWPPGRRWGEGEAGLRVRSANKSCTSCFSICVTPVSVSLARQWCSTLASWGRIQKPGEDLSTGSPGRPTSLPPTGLLASSTGPNGNFIKGKTIQLFSIMQQVKAAQSTGLGVRMLESAPPPPQIA